ncbi:lactonase family protein [Microbacterium wangruii]|uniref:lactonase family protein n=1 Tax=Microbacterium wangruii TaxID=3049073 RepID=UPI00256F1FDA|nr:beta-propeller fold lactonase family protein [Microbacterium sp. zg-Y1211]MDL5487304.1 beta-propeller fold lactonase family protein [Microbacterium sp. zg-Y1211]
MRFLVGGYTADMRGEARGVGVLRAGEADSASAGGPLAFECEAVDAAGSPSWLTWHPALPVVYAAMEGAGTVQAFRRSGATGLVRHGAPVAVGEAPCHVAVASNGTSLIASCWGDGRIVRVRLDADGRPEGGGAIAAAAAARDPYADGGMGMALGVPRGTSATLVPGVPGVHGVPGASADAADEDEQRDLAAAARALREVAGAEFSHLVPDYAMPDDSALGAHGLGDVAGARGALTDADRSPEREGEPGGEAARTSRAHQALFLPRGVLAATDMGLDLVRFWRATEGGGSRALPDVVLPRGSGPRHMVWHPSGHLYVVTELSREVFVLAPDASGAWRLVSGGPLSPATLASDTAAEVCLSRDGQFVYAGVRGSDTLAVLRVRGDGSELVPVALADAGVAGPRHHTIVLDTLLVAGQASGEVAGLTLDVRTGVPGRARVRTAVPTPTCLVPLR